MAKNVNEVLTKVKGDKVSDLIAGKGSFSKTGFGDLVNALANDSTFKVKTYDKEGNVAAELSVSDLIREDLKKTIAKANYPQKTEAAVLDSCEIVTAGLAEAIPQIIMQQIGSGKKFDLPMQKNVQGSIFLKEVPGRTKDTTIRDPKTQNILGTVTSTSKDSLAVAVKSSVPSHLVTKVRKDTNGKVI